MIRIRAIRDAVDFETSLADLRLRSERRAWWIAGVSLFLLLCSGSALFFLVPLKERVPYLVMANAYTGQAVMSRLSDRLPATLASNEALDRANLSTFVRARESYDSSTLGDRDWNQVFAMASADVGAAYRLVHDSSSAAQPFKIYGTSSALRPELLTLQLDPTEIRGSRKATVRFIRRVVEKSTGVTRVLDRRIAQIEYRYVPGMELDDRNRLLNPLGFQVTAYRVDVDFSNGGGDA